MSSTLEIHPENYWCLFAICITSLVKGLYRSFAHFLFGLFLCLLLNLEVLYIFCVQSPCRIYDLQIFLMVCNLCFHPFNRGLQSRVFHFYANLLICPLIDHAFVIESKASQALLPSFWSQSLSFMFFSRKIIILHLNPHCIFS